ncbi:MAG: hypothetical protein LDLANPLL_00092 [Turneriella sp.]|nr:hypothetical protein [Turneriella sp.]
MTEDAKNNGIIQEHAHAREEFTNVRVSRAGTWFTGEKPIINYNIISHFKQNLFRDTKGVYIYQTFRQFAEKGYITVEGPLLSVFRVDENILTFDNLDTLPSHSAKIIQNLKDGSLYVFYPRLGCYASVPASVSPDFSLFLEEKVDGFTFCGTLIEKKRIIQWV